MPVIQLRSMTSRKRQAVSNPEGAPLLKKKAGCEPETVLPQQLRLVVDSRNGSSDRFLRRKASTCAELSLQRILNGSPPSSPTSSLLDNTGLQVCVGGDGYLPASVLGLVQSSLDISNHDAAVENPESDCTDISFSLPLDRSFSQQRKGSITSVDSPMSPLSSVDSDVDDCFSPRPAKLSQHKLKDPVISIVDCKKRACVIRPVSFGIVDSSGFVKRMASMNARACVTALLEPEFKVSRYSRNPRASSVRNANRKRPAAVHSIEPRSSAVVHSNEPKSTGQGPTALHSNEPKSTSKSPAALHSSEPKSTSKSPAALHSNEPKSTSQSPAALHSNEPKNTSQSLGAVHSIDPYEKGDEAATSMCVSAGGSALKESTRDSSPSRTKESTTVTSPRNVLVLGKANEERKEEEEQQQNEEEEEEGVASDLYGIPFNSMGLLYNGDSVHPSTQVFLSSERELPQPIFPQVVPIRVTHLGNALQTARQQHKDKAKKPRAVKGDNGWTCIGDPIKTIHYKKGGNLITRKYYVAIKRRNEEVCVRDTVTVKSGTRKEDAPFIAKIAAFWQESDGIMMTLLWYYRPEDIEGASLAEFAQNELLASQHLDDNSVACIEGKRYVLGFRQFCRYHAAARRSWWSRGNKVSFVPQSTTPVLSEPRLPSAKDLATTSVYLSYRSYNHITGCLPK